MESPSHVRWMIGFSHSAGRDKSEIDFPIYSFWHTDFKDALNEATKVLSQLRIDFEDSRDWQAYICADGVEIAKGFSPRHPFLVSYNCRRCHRKFAKPKILLRDMRCDICSQLSSRQVR